MHSTKTKKRHKLTLEFSEEQYQSFINFAASKNKRPGTFGREIILKAIEEDQGFLAEPERSDYDEGLTILRPSLTPDELRALDVIANQYKVSRNKALAILVRSLDGYVLAPDDIALLRESTMNLGKLGKNINQIARGLAITNKHQVLTRDLFESINMFKAYDRDFADELKKHIALAAQVLNKGAKK